MINPMTRDANQNRARLGLGVGWRGGGVGYVVDMSQGTCPRLAVTVWTWMQWMSACPYPRTCRPRDPWTPVDGTREGGFEEDEPPPPSYLHHSR